MKYQWHKGLPKPHRPPKTPQGLITADDALCHLILQTLCHGGTQGGMLWLSAAPGLTSRVQQEGFGYLQSRSTTPVETGEVPADAPGGLRRSGRVRTEVVMTDYEAGTDAAEGRVINNPHLLLWVMLLARIALGCVLTSGFANEKEICLSQKG